MWLTVYRHFGAQILNANLQLQLHVEEILGEVMKVMRVASQVKLAASLFGVVMMFRQPAD